MLRVAYIKENAWTKECIFEIGKIYNEQDWTYTIFPNHTAFQHALKTRAYSVLILQDQDQKDASLDNFLNQDENNICLIIQEKPGIKEITEYQRIFFLQENRIVEEMQRLKRILRRKQAMHDHYKISYYSECLFLQIQDILYIEKRDKYLLFHTKKGVLKERNTMKEVEQHLNPYGFLRVHSSFLVQMIYTSHIGKEELTLINQENIPIARSRKNDIQLWFQSHISNKEQNMP